MRFTHSRVRPSSRWLPFHVPAFLHSSTPWTEALMAIVSRSCRLAGSCRPTFSFPLSFPPFRTHAPVHPFSTFPSRVFFLVDAPLSPVDRKREGCSSRSILRSLSRGKLPFSRPRPEKFWRIPRLLEQEEVKRSRGSNERRRERKRCKGEG